MMNSTATLVFVLFFIGVKILGFVAAHWRKADLGQLDEWGLGGRRVDTIDRHVVPAGWRLIYGTRSSRFPRWGVWRWRHRLLRVAVHHLLIYPFAFVVFSKLWAISKKFGYVTATDFFVHARYNSRMLALAIAVTDIVATMPYIALQLVGIEVVISAVGFDTTGFVGDLRLIIAFAILAAYTYTSGLRAPAMIAVAKDMLIYITIIAAMIIISAGSVRSSAMSIRRRSC